MTAPRVRSHDSSVSREQHTDLWRVDCPTCGPVAIGQGYRADAVAIAARHRQVHPSPPGEAPDRAEREIPGRAQIEHARVHHRASERRDLDCPLPR